MKTRNLFALLLAFAMFTRCSFTSKKEIVIGKVDNIYSNVLKENREIWIHVPERSVLSSEKFNVVYLLDGESHFTSFTGLLQQMSTINGNTISPRMIVVGIANIDRTRDLTPTPIKSSPYMDSEGLKNSGGGKSFIEFIEKELLPYINEKYPTSGHNILIGHSFGGLTVLNTLINKPELFNSYVAIDPSLWWDDQKWMQEVEQKLMNNKIKDKSLFFAVANTMTPYMDTAAVRKDTTTASLHFRSNLHFSDVLKKLKNNGLKLECKYYNEENHSSVPLVAEYDALRFLFNRPVEIPHIEGGKNDSILAVVEKEPINTASNNNKSSN